MTKWEYAAIRVGAAYDWNVSGSGSRKLTFEISTAKEEINLPPDETKILLELNRMGSQGWEIVSVNYDRLPDGVIIEYFLKRPLVE
jgi:hypothetical protein